MTATGKLRPAGPDPAAAAERRAALAVSVLDAREHRPITIPRTKVAGVMRLLSRSEVAQVRSECRHVMRALGIEGIGIEGFVEWREEFNTRLIAVAIRDPAARDLPLAPLEEWELCDDDQIAALWDAYQDMQAELDPLGAGLEITAAEWAAIEEAAKKKDEELLASYGSRKLARVLTGLGARSQT